MKKLYLFISICVFVNAVAFAQSPHAAQLYGVTTFGGNNYLGSIFHYTPSTNSFTTDYSFQTKVKGAAPKCKIVAPGNGKYYGTTTSGGNYNAGVIFEWDSTTNNYTEPYHFTGTDGNDARGEMIEYDHKFYGVTNLGGVNNAGVIYEWDYTNNVYTKKVDMDSANGSNPDGTLTLIGTKFYGFTHTGGQYNKGVLFEWDITTNTYTKQFDFDSTKGSNPVGKLVPFNGKLYAMCNAGGSANKGTLYEWDYTANTITKKVDFNGTNGSHPLGFLSLYNSKFYATTFDGGINQYGIIFEYNATTNLFTKKIDLGFIYYPQLSTRRSVLPLGSLTLKENVFWGITSQGGFGQGAIFSYDPTTNIFSDYFNNNSSGGTTCDASLTTPAAESYESFLVSGNNLLGTYSAYGATYKGCIFKFLPDSNQVVNAVHMGAADGLYPNTSLTRLNNKLYGVTATGGNNHNGNIFEFDLNSHQYSSRFEFDGFTTGLQPKTSLTYCNGKFYGVNSRGKSFNGGIGVGNTQTFASAWNTNRSNGEIYSWDPANNVFQTINYTQQIQAYFNYPNAPFINYNNKLYTVQPDNYKETATNINVSGTIIEYNTITDTFKSKGIVNAADGYFPFSTPNGLSYYNGKFYGMTSAGAVTYNSGAMIYEWDTTAHVGIKKVVLDSVDGFTPYGSLVLVGKEFYGLTSNEGNNATSQTGVLFRWNPATNVLKKCSQLAYKPYGNPTYSEGKIYFTSANLFGLTIYAYDPVLDTSYRVTDLSTNPGNWNTGCSVPNAYLQLLEVIPNQAPFLSNTPATVSMCANQPPQTTSFTLSDADNDTVRFHITSTNAALIPVQNISITHTDSIYTITYTSSVNQSGSSVISVIANDGYGDSVSFSFKVTVVAANPITCTPVPVTLLSFTAQAKGKNVLLNWQTATEINTAKFIVERSIDGIHFADADIVMAKGTGDNNYNFVDSDNIQNNAVVYFRIQMMDKDGSSAYSNIVPIKTAGSKAFFSLTPNPANDFLLLRFNSTVINGDLCIYNSTGAKVLTKSFKTSIGEMRINVGDISPGIYFVRVKANVDTYGQELIISSR